MKAWGGIQGVGRETVVNSQRILGVKLCIATAFNSCTIISSSDNGRCLYTRALPVGFTRHKKFSSFG